MGKFDNYYELFGITKYSSDEDILAAFRRRTEDITEWKQEKLPPGELLERVELYKQAMSTICEERRIPFSNIAVYLQGCGYYEDPYEREKGIPVMLVGFALICLGIFSLLKTYDQDNQHVSVLAFYLFVCGFSFILHCLSGGRNFTEAMRVCYPITLKTGRRNAGRGFLKKTFLPSMFLLVFLFFLVKINSSVYFAKILSMHISISMFALFSISDFYYDNR